MFINALFEDGYEFEKEFDYSFEMEFGVLIKNHGKIVRLLVIG